MFIDFDPVGGMQTGLNTSCIGVNRKVRLSDPDSEWTKLTTDCDGMNHNLINRKCFLGTNGKENTAI